MHNVQGTETGKHRYKEPVIGYTRGRKVVYSMIGFLIALLSGALMSIQGVFNTQVTKASSVWAASAFVQASAPGSVSGCMAFEG